MTDRYEATLNFLYSRLPVFQHIGKAAYKADLHNTIALMKATGNPESSFRSVHVAGTNGKGSVSSLLASVFTEHGLKTGLYTSPHLKDFRERICINGEMISKEEVIDFTERVKSLIEEIHPSFFEITVAMAFDHFRRHRVDMAVIEVGMGGRLDSTNVITPELSVITNIGFDHMEFLGNSLGEIAAEKAGIIKSGIPVVVGEFQEETAGVFQAKALQEGCRLAFAGVCPDHWEELCPLKGNYQKKNLATLKTATDELVRLELISDDPEKTENGIRHVKSNTGLRGRWEILGEHPMVVADTGHNEHGLRIVLDQLKELPHQKLHIVLGVVNDKDLSKVLPLFPADARYYFCRPSVMRGLESAVLKERAAEYGLSGDAFATVGEAVIAAKRAADKNDVVFIGGSTFVVADALPD